MREMRTDAADANGHRVDATKMTDAMQMQNHNQITHPKNRTNTPAKLKEKHDRTHQWEFLALIAKGYRQCRRICAREQSVRQSIIQIGARERVCVCGNESDDQAREWEWK